MARPASAGFFSGAGRSIARPVSGLVSVNFGVAAHDAQRQPVGRLAAQIDAARRDSAPSSGARRSASALADALAGEAQAAVGLRAAVESGVAAEHACAAAA